MRIITYPNPHDIKQHEELWSLFKLLPHFCASDTLKQGLEHSYGRESFGDVLSSVDTLVNAFLKETVNDIELNIRLFLTVAEEIRTLNESELKKSLRFNIYDVVDSVKLLNILGANADLFSTNITLEQACTLDIYRCTKIKGIFSDFEAIKRYTYEECGNIIKRVLFEEIEYFVANLPIIKDRIEYFIINSFDDALTRLKYILIMILEIEEGYKHTPFAENYDYSKDKIKINHFLNIIGNYRNSVINRIIIHGIHKITPEIYFVINLLESVGIDVVFVLNYVKNLPKTYETWKKVYEWTKCEFENESDLNLNMGKEIGRSISSIIEGRDWNRNLEEKIVIYPHLTSFTDREVRRTFQPVNSLASMKTQYYAVDGNSSNEILKMYFPEQFKQRPFLSYPIGQFILGLYNMWDFEENRVEINNVYLSECAVSKVYSSNSNTNILETINRVKQYYSDLKFLDQYIARTEQLLNSLDVIEKNEFYTPLKKISYFNISKTSAEDFRGFLKFIQEVSESLFKKDEKEIDFGDHFNTLIEILKVPTQSSSNTTNVEKELIYELSERLQIKNNGNISGNIEDVKEALFYYLASTDVKDTSNWIVRNFEQLDGAVMLKSSKAETYHLSMLSNTNMTRQTNDVLPWPITKEMFFGYSDLEGAIPVITTAILERRNFLRFLLFYGTFFSRKKIKLSYIKEENGEEQSLYYLLRILGLKEEIFKEQTQTGFVTDETNIVELNGVNILALRNEEKEMFSICPYKFMQNRVLKSPIEYSSEFHIKYYVSNFMYFYIRQTQSLDDGNVNEVLDREFDRLKRIFPYWGSSVFADIKNETRSQLKKSREREGLFSKFQPQLENDYKLRKENFLIAQWLDENNARLMNFQRDGINDLIRKYMLSSALYPVLDEVPNHKICENCNFNDVCLRDYYDARISRGGNIDD